MVDRQIFIIIIIIIIVSNGYGPELIFYVSRLIYFLKSMGVKLSSHPISVQFCMRRQFDFLYNFKTNRDFSYTKFITLQG